MNCPKCNSSMNNNACLRCGYNGEAREIYIQHNTSDGKVNSGSITALIIGATSALVLVGCIVFFISKVLR